MTSSERSLDHRPLLEIQDLTVQFNTLRGPLKAVDRVSLSISEGETLGIVGESGCGKSITSLALMGLLPPTANVTAARLSFMSKDLMAMPESERRKMRGGDVAMIFQDPMTSLNPSFTVGYQIIETLREHARAGEDSSAAHLKERAIELLRQVGIPAPETRLDSYPHQLSGGMSQRVMIAIAIACRPKLLIADEPTTALDVTIQAQILRLLKDLQKKFGMALILITHDLGVVSQMADRIVVMYAGQVVEVGPAAQLMAAPSHPYTEGLLKCLPVSHGESGHRKPLPTIGGMVPDLTRRPSGCQLSPRCPYVQTPCRTGEPPLLEVAPGRDSKCLFPLDGSRSHARGPEGHA